MTTELVPKEITPSEVFKPNGLDIVIAGIDKKVNEHLNGSFDIAVEKDRKAIKSFAYKVRRSKTFIDGKGKDFVAEIKAQAKEIDAERKRFRDFCDTSIEKVTSPVVEWEQAEEKRISSIKDKIEEMKLLEDFPEFPTSEDVKSRIDSLPSVTESYFQEYTDCAKEVYVEVCEKLESILVKAEKHEAEQAELELLRKAEADRIEKEKEELREKEQAKREERLKKESAEKAAREAEERIRFEREEKERIEREAKEAAERAEREKIEAIENAKREAAMEAERKEQERLAKERSEKEHAERLAANRRHQAAINNRVLDGLKAEGVSEELAKHLIKIVVMGKIPELKILY